MADRLTDTAEREVLRTRRRFARRRWARHRHLGKAVVAAVLAVAVAVTAGWLVLFSDHLDVEGVEVQGVESLRAGEVREAAAVPQGVPLARLDLSAIRARVAALASVRSVDVSRQWPDQVLVRVEERTAVAVVSIGGQVRGLDASGIVFDHFRRAPAGLPRVELADAEVPTDALREAAQVVAALPDDLAARVDHVEVATVDELSLALRDGRTVRWGSAEESEQKAAVLADLVASHEAPIYDVSVPGQPTVCTQPTLCG